MMIAIKYKLFTPHINDPYSKIPPATEPLKLDASGRAVSPARRSDSLKINPEKNNGSDKKNILERARTGNSALINQSDDMKSGTTRLMNSSAYDQDNLTWNRKVTRLASSAIDNTPEIARALTSQVVPNKSANSVMLLNSINRKATPRNQKCQSGRND